MERTKKTTAPWPSDPTLLHIEEQRNLGRKLVLDTIRSAGEIARIDLAQITNNSPATMTAIIAELLNAGLVEEIADACPNKKSGRGRPRVKLKIRGDKYQVAGLKVSRHSISVIITDFEGHALTQHEFSLTKAKMSANELRDKILTALDAACLQSHLKRTDLAAVGIGLAGQIDARRNFVHWCSSLQERNVEFGKMLHKKAGIPVFIDNDANLVTRTEQLFGKGKNIDNFIVITVDHGVGMGIVIDNKIYRGQRGCGAEFGHTKVQLEGALCQCGQRGCLEAYLGDYALLREALVKNDEDHYESVQALFEAAQAGDSFAYSIFNRAERMFAMGLANVINIFDPKLVILSGARANSHFLYTEETIAQMQQLVVKVDEPLPNIITHDWGDIMWAKGAAAYAIECVSTLKVNELIPNGP